MFLVTKSTYFVDKPRGCQAHSQDDLRLVQGPSALLAKTFER